MFYGLRHLTSRRWHTKTGGESPHETLARPFDTEGAADEHRKTFEAFAGAWKVEPLGVTRDGEGSVNQRTAAWAFVEDAQSRLNEAARTFLPKECEALSVARIAWQSAPRCSPSSAVLWREVAAVQHLINEAAPGWEPLGSYVKVLRQSLEEYVRIGGSPDRKPGVGGLS